MKDFFLDNQNSPVCFASYQEADKARRRIRTWKFTVTETDGGYGLTIKEGHKLKWLYQDGTIV